jgi:hypothetical protein
MKPVVNLRGVDRICCKSAPWSIDTHPLYGQHTNGVDCAVYLSMADMQLQSRSLLREILIKSICLEDFVLSPTSVLFLLITQLLWT